MVALSEVVVDLVAAHDEARFRALMQAHHYLGALPGVGETLRYVAHHRGQWLALVVFSAPALKCAARDRWIGWSFAVQFDRLHLLTNNSRFLLLPGAPRNLGSRVLALCTRRLVSDWPARFGHRLLLLETFVDPARFRGTVYRAANWVEVGRTRGFRRQRRGYSYREHGRPKLVFVHPLCRDARTTLQGAHLDPSLRHGVPKMMLTAAQMRSLPEFFHSIDDPRRRQGRRHALPTVLALATAATLCGMRGYKAISEWVDDLSPKVLERFRVRRRNGQHRAPSLSAMRSLLIRIDPAQLDAALRAWHQTHGSGDTALAIDGKTLRGAHYLFTVKGNQPNMLDDIRLTLDEHIAQRAPDFTDSSPKPEHGRRERRSIWVSSALNDYLDFPGVAQVFAIGRQSVEVNSGKRHRETVYGVTSLSPQGASPQRLLSLNRGHWTIEATHHILDWSFDEDCSRIRTGHGPENMTRLRRFAIGLIKARGLAVAETMRRLARNPRRVLDFLKMTANACPRAAPA